MDKFQNYTFWQENIKQKRTYITRHSSYTKRLEVICCLSEGNLHNLRSGSFLLTFPTRLKVGRFNEHAVLRGFLLPGFKLGWPSKQSFLCMSLCFYSDKSTLKGLKEVPAPA